MKKAIKLIFIGVVALTILLVVFDNTYIGDERFDDGVYRVIDNSEYPNAYIIVENDSIQFVGIDLNKIYQKKQAKEVKDAIDKGFDLNVTDKDIKKESNLNAVFVDNKYDFSDCEGEEDGTFKTLYYLLTPSKYFGLVLVYDAFHKTIHINNEIQEMTFKNEGKYDKNS